MTSVVAPDIEAARNIFVAKDLRHAFVLVPALIVNTGGEDVGITAVTIEIPRIADVWEIVHRNVEVAVVVVVAAEKVGGVEGSAHGEHAGEDIWVTERHVHCVVPAEAGADGADSRVLVELADEGNNFVDDVVTVLYLAGDSPARWDIAVVPAFAVDRVDTVELEVAVFELVLKGADHLAIFKLVEAATGCGEDDGGIARVPEDQQFHVATEGR